MPSAMSIYAAPQQALRDCLPASHSHPERSEESPYMPIVTHLPVNTGRREGDHREPGAGSREPEAETAIGCPLTAIRCQRALFLPAPTVILSASEGSWYMPIVTHLPLNTSQREGTASVTVGQ